MINREIIFEVFEGMKAKAIIVEGKCVKIKLLFKAGRMHYYSFLNDAGKAFEEKYPQYC